MEVRTLRVHDNAYGDKFQKPVGYEYDHPAPAGLIRDKIVEEVKEKPASKKPGE